MPKLWQFPIKAEPNLPEALRPEVTTPDKWHSPLSEPTRRTAWGLVAAAIIASGTAYVVDPLTLDTGDADEASVIEIITEVSGKLKYQYQALTQPIDFGIAPPVEVTLDSWYSPLAEPVRVKKPLPIAAYPTSWDDSDALTQPEVTSLDKWYSPLAEPPSPDPRSEAALIVSSGGLFQIDVGDLDASAEELAWYKDLELHLSVYTKKRAPEFPSHTIDPELLTQPEVTSLDKWYQALSEPLRVKEPINVSFGEFRTELELVVVEEVTLDKWWQPHSEPVRVKPRASSFPELEIDSDALTRPEATTLDRWHQPLSEFLHKTKRSAAALEPASVIDSDQLTQPEFTSLDKWAQPTNEPVRVEARLLTALQEAFFVDANIAAVPPAEEITLDKWYKPLEEPVRVKSRASEFPTHTNDTEGLTLPEGTSLDKWYSPFSEPVRVQPRSLAGLLAGGLFQGDPTDTVEPLPEFMDWFKGLDEPVLPRVLPISNYPSTFFEQEVSELDPSAELLAWYVDLSVPTLPDARIVEFPAFEIDSDLLTQPEVTSLDKWFVALSEPLRTKPPLPVGAIPTTIESLEPVIVIVLGWDVPLSEPIFVIDPTIPLKPSFFIDPAALTLPEVTTLDKWFTPLSEPVRIGDRLIVPRLPAAVGFKLPITITVPIKSFISKEADQTHTSREADQTHISKEADMTKDNPRC